MPTFPKLKNPEFIRALAARLRQLREERGLQVEELAAISNVSASKLLHLEDGRYSMTLDVLISVAQGLGIPMQELLNFSASNPPE